MINKEAGKGDTYRQVNRQVFEENFDTIFGKKKMTYKDTTFCSGSKYCATTSCHRHKQGAYYGNGPDIGELIAIAPFHLPDLNGKICTHFQQKENNEDDE